MVLCLSAVPGTGTSPWKRGSEKGVDDSLVREDKTRWVQSRNFEVNVSGLGTVELTHGREIIFNIRLTVGLDYRGCFEGGRVGKVYVSGKARGVAE